MPGEWIAWVRDDNLNMTSNRVKIPIRFTTASIPACIEIVGDSKETVFKRKWHGEWLQKVVPELAIEWWSHDTAEDKKQQMEASIAKSLQAARAYVADSKNQQAIKSAIDRINKQHELAAKP